MQLIDSSCSYWIDPPDEVALLHEKRHMTELISTKIITVTVNAEHPYTVKHIILLLH